MRGHDNGGGAVRYALGDRTRGGMDDELARILSAGLPRRPSETPIDDVRALRAECQQVETGLSFVRRLVQGRLDIVRGELARRKAGGDPADLSTLIGKLPEILSDRTRAPGVGRLPTLMAPGDVHGALADALDAIVAEGHLDSLPEVADDELESMRARLEAARAHGVGPTPRGVRPGRCAPSRAHSALPHGGGVRGVAAAMT